MDRKPAEEWQRRFKRYGFIEAEIIQDEVAGQLKRFANLSDSPPPLTVALYRGSSKKSASRWSWTDKIVGAVNFSLEFHDGLPAVWVCDEVQDYLARFNFNDRSESDGVWTFWSEFIVVPRSVRQLSVDEVSELLPDEVSRSRWLAANGRGGAA
jgi:hypothetical protein